MFAEANMLGGEFQKAGLTTSVPEESWELATGSGEPYN